MNSKKRLGVFTIPLMLLTLVVLPLAAQVVVLTTLPGVTSVSGGFVLIHEPVSIDTNVLESDTQAFVFLERQGFALTETLDVNTTGTGTFDTTGSLTGGTIAKGTVVNSYFIHFDRIQQPAQTANVKGGITFANEILGVIVLTAELNASNAELKFPGTTYGIDNGLEMGPTAADSQDTFTISSNRRTLTVDLNNNVQTDQIRVITSITGSSTGGSTNTPVANNDTASTTTGKAVAIDVLSNDTDPNNNLDKTSVTVTTNPSNGTVAVNATTGVITYTPNSTFTGTDTLVYQVCDKTTPTKLCDTATVTVTVSTSGTPTGTLVTILPAASDCSKFAQASIDIVPGNRDNLIRLDDVKGTTTVAILGTEEFPAPNCVDTSTITFGKTGVEQKPISCGAVNTNFDRWLDITCDFDTSRLGFVLGDTKGVLKAKTIKNDIMTEQDKVTVVAPRRFPVIPHEPMTVKTLNVGKSLFFVAQGVVAAMNVEVFNVLGQKIYESGFSTGSALRWNLRTSAGAPLANGIYFYVVTLKSADGQVSHQLVKMALILR